MISQNSIQKVLDTSSVQDIIADYINLKKRGSNFLGLCPFHSEKTPSFTVSPTKNIYKCFGCGRGGGAVQFLMEHEKFSFPEAIRHLAERYRIELDETETSQEQKELQSIKDSMYIVTDLAAKYYAGQLHDTLEGKNIGLQYFKSRGFIQKTIKHFGLGYAPEAKDTFTAWAVSQGYNIDILRKAGLTTQYDRDFFRNRVMIPIYGLSGKVIGFGGRIMGRNPKEPKYINSPESEIYEKRRILYGLYQGRKEIQRRDQCILVEGYTDVISLHQSGVENVLASSGTSLTEDQIRLIGRYTKHILILFDGDKAGTKAAMRGIDLILEQDMNVKIASLPPEHDPDSYIQAVGSIKFLEYLERNALDFILFKAKQLEQETANDPVKRAEIIGDIVQSISAISDTLKRALYVKQCAEIFNLTEETIINTLNVKIRERLNKQHKARQRQERQQQSSNEASWSSKENIDQVDPASSSLINGDLAISTNSDYFQERDVVRVLMVHGHKSFDEDGQSVNITQYVMEKLEDLVDDGFINPLYAKIMKDVSTLFKSGTTPHEHYFTTHIDPEIVALAIHLTSEPFHYSENWEKLYRIYLQMQKMPELNHQKDARQACLRFLLRKYKKMSEENKEHIKRAITEDRKDDIPTCLKVQAKINALITDLTTELGMVVL